MAWAKKVPAPTSTMPIRTAGRLGRTRQRQAEAATGQRRPEGGPGAEALHGVPGERRRGHRREEDEIDEAERHGADAERRLHQHEIDEGEGADEGEQDAEADGEARAQGRVLADA